MTRSVEFRALGLAMERKKFEPWMAWEASAKLAENEKFKDPENEAKHPWAYSQGEQQMILNSYRYFQKTLKDPSQAVKTTDDALKVRSSMGKQNKEPKTLLRSRQFH